MNANTGYFPIDFEQAALACGETPSFFPALKKHIYAKIKNYDPEFGAYMLEHLEKTSSEARIFLVEIGVDPKAANVIADAFSLHDAGKILQPIELWALSKNKPNRTKEEKEERAKHGELGVQVLNNALNSLGIKPTEREKGFILLTEQFMVLHHERLDGSGPQKMKYLDRILQAVGPIDEIDGKGKNKILRASFEEMNGKHQAKFNQTIVAQYHESTIRRNIQPTALLPSQGLQI